MASFYQGEVGAEYFRYQLSASQEIAALEASKFAHAIQSDHTVVDFGCGSGRILAELGCARRIGIEVNPVARQHADVMGIECHESLSEIRSMSVDVVISNHSLEHVERPVDVLREMRRILTSSGRLVICVPIDDWRNSRQYDPCDPNHHLYTWSVQLLGNCLVAAGFRVGAGSIRVLSTALPGHRCALIRKRLPRWLFRALCSLLAVVLRRRQLIADVSV
jgi:SAM-dependent methyltransferase